MSHTAEIVARSSREAERVPLTLDDVYSEHTEFIWKTLHRMGFRLPVIEDVFQEVFVVVLRRLGSFDGRSATTTWLFGICLRVARGYRRRAHFRRERIVADVDDATRAVATEATPEEELERRESEMLLFEILDQLDIEQRAVFVMFEFDGLSCQEIAEMIGVAVG